MISKLSKLIIGNSLNSYKTCSPPVRILTMWKVFHKIYIPQSSWPKGNCMRKHLASMEATVKMVKWKNRTQQPCELWFWYRLLISQEPSMNFRMFTWEAFFCFLMEDTFLPDHINQPAPAVGWQWNRGSLWEYAHYYFFLLKNIETYCICYKMSGGNS